MTLRARIGESSSHGRPRGLPVPADFEVRPAPAAEPGVAADVLYLSVDPYLRGRLSGRHVTGPIVPGEPMDSELVVRTAQDSAVGPAGTLARAFGPWQERVHLPEDALVPLAADLDPPSLALRRGRHAGAHGIRRRPPYPAPRRGETAVISSAAGPVGATVGQLCKAAGARAIGIARQRGKARLAGPASRLRRLHRPPRIRPGRAARAVPGTGSTCTSTTSAATCCRR